MPLTTNAPRDIEIYVEEKLQALKFPAFSAASLKTLPTLRYSAVYVTDTSKPAWADATGAYRYADGTLV